MLPFQQRPPHPRRDPALDGLRGLAILLVFLFHYGGGLRAGNPLLRGLGYVTQSGWIGVNVFFALSGFLITNNLADALFSHPRIPLPGFSRTPQALRSFLVRRALRIFPLYYAALTACAAAAILTGAHFLQLKPLLIYTFFLQNLPSLVNPALQTPPPLPLFHLWSLAVEEQFYLLWPFLLLAARTHRRASHLSLWTFFITTVARALLFNPHLLPYGTAEAFATFLPVRAGALTLGAALALSPRDGRTPQRNIQAQKQQNRPSPQHPVKPLLLTTVAALVLLLLAGFFNHSFLLNSPAAYTLTLPAADLLAACLVALALEPILFRAILSTSPLTLLGRISYGFYVFHILLEPLFDRLGTLLTHTHTGFAYQAARLLVAFPLTTAAAWLSFILLERPFLRLKSRFPSSLPSAT